MARKGFSVEVTFQRRTSRRERAMNREIQMIHVRAVQTPKGKDKLNMFGSQKRASVARKD